jgi:hypothetical protein
VRVPCFDDAEANLTNKRKIKEETLGSFTCAFLQDGTILNVHFWLEESVATSSEQKRLKRTCN